jgi:predicted KAP-like P-loop ATPase
MINQYFSDQAVTHLDSSRTDGFEFEDRARKLTQKLANSSGNISMGIRGGWGEGKTSFLKTMQRVGMAKAHSYYNDGKVVNVNDQNFLKDKEFAGQSFPVFFNAWQYEREENPLAALCGTIVNQLSVNAYFLKTAKIMKS